MFSSMAFKRVTHIQMFLNDDNIEKRPEEMVSLSEPSHISQNFTL